MNTNSKIMIGILALALASFIVIIMLLPLSIASNIPGLNYKNVTVHTNVTITHSKPDVLNVSVYDAQNYSIKNITIVAGNYKKIYCNATVRSWEGFNDISAVNATLYNFVVSNQSASDNFNAHYSNSSCTLNGSITGLIGWFMCSFDVIYFANNGTWICNVTISNSYTQINNNFTGSGFGSTLFYPVYALNVTDGIDYGGVAVEDYSAPDRQANITNLGNMGINISVEGYAVNRSDGLAMICNLNGNITVDNEKFSSKNGTSYPSKTSLTSSPGGILIPNLTMAKQTNVSILSANSTYWQLYVPANPAGNCTGNIIFTALSS